MRLDEILSNLSDEHIKGDFNLLYSYILDINKNNYINEVDINHLCYINKIVSLNALFDDLNNVSSVRDYLIYNYKEVVYKMSKKDFVYCISSYAHMLDKSSPVIDINKLYLDINKIINKHKLEG